MGDQNGKTLHTTFAGRAVDRRNMANGGNVDPEEWETGPFKGNVVPDRPYNGPKPKMAPSKEARPLQTPASGAGGAKLALHRIAAFN